MEQPNVHPIAFKELKVGTYVELIEALNFNFSRIANSPLFRGKKGNTGDDGDPGISGLRGNRLYYADVDRLNEYLDADYNLDTNKFDLSVLNNTMSVNYEGLKAALRADILIANDWCILPDGFVCILVDVLTDDGQVQGQTWVSAGMQILTSNDTTLKTIIEELVNNALNGKEFGTMKLYDIGFNIVKDDISLPGAEQSNLAATDKVGGLSIKLPGVSANTNTSSTWCFNALTDDDTHVQGRWPIYIFGSPRDWYDIVQATLPEYDAVDPPAHKNAGYLPNGGCIPSAIIMQDNDYAGLLIGNRHKVDADTYSVRNFASIANIVTNDINQDTSKPIYGLSLKPRFSRWLPEDHRLFDEYVNELFLARELADMSFIKSNNFAFKVFVEESGDTPALEDAIAVATRHDESTGQVVITPLFKFGENTVVKLPKRLANGILMADDGELTIAKMLANKLVITDKEGAPITAPGKANSFAGFNEGGQYSEIAMPLAPEYILLESEHNNHIAHIKHQHKMPAFSEFEGIAIENNFPTVYEIRDSEVAVYTVINFPLMHPPVPDTLDLLANVESILIGGANSNVIGAAKLTCKTSYAIWENQSTLEELEYHDMDEDSHNSTKSIVLTECTEREAIPSYEDTLVHGQRFVSNFVMFDAQAQYWLKDKKMPTRIVIRQTFAKTKFLNMQHVWTTSPKVTMQFLYTDIGINRQNVYDPEYDGVGFWVVANPNVPTDIDFYVSANDARKRNRRLQR